MNISQVSMVKPSDRPRAYISNHDPIRIESLSMSHKVNQILPRWVHLSCPWMFCKPTGYRHCFVNGFVIFYSSVRISRLYFNNSYPTLNLCVGMQ